MKIVFVGSGNVATHFSKALKACAYDIIQVFSPTEKNAYALGTALGVAWTSSVHAIDRTAQIYIYAIKDNSIAEICKQISAPDAIHVHTAGSVPLSVFESIVPKYGVLYPLQTFSKQKNIETTEIPIFVEAINKEVENVLLSLAKSLSNNVLVIDSMQRRKMHVAAVFACNFTNYMFDIAAQIMEDAGLPFSYLNPLIVETADKIKTLTPFEAQTGPAVRFDSNTISKHLSLLTNKPELHKIYNELTTNIYKRHNE